MLRLWKPLVVAALLLTVNGYAQSAPSKPVVSLSPAIHVREKTPVVELNPIPIVPAYPNHDRLLTSEQLRLSSRVLGNGLGRQLIDAQESIYISGTHNEQEWAIYRVMAEFSRGEHSVQAVRKIAHAQLGAHQDALTKLEVVTQQQEILLGDIALPNLSSGSIAAPLEPTSITSIGVNILGSVKGTHFIGENQTVVLNRGLLDGIERGNIFDLLDFSALQESGQPLPQRRIGQLVVMRVYPHFSLAVVTHSQDAITTDTQLRPVKSDRS
ncbi:hypothetical protein [Vibrio galatheae]|uniref:hypothetical protein n=1 Tax=Vibrio galatheae TaxID=579748 RepID=UPI0006978A1C|nr:hypothetical protein [Vibrio galatheae]